VELTQGSACLVERLLVSISSHLSASRSATMAASACLASCRERARSIRLRKIRSPPSAQFEDDFGSDVVFGQCFPLAAADQAGAVWSESGRADVVTVIAENASLRLRRKVGHVHLEVALVEIDRS